jgi:SAM-dependent methyltransferase
MKEPVREFAKALVPAALRPSLRTVYTRICYLGFRYKCPICNSHLRTFLPFGSAFPVLTEKRVVGGGHRLQAVCPLCGCVDRSRLLYLYLLHKTDVLQKPTRLLHVAPEAPIARMLRHHRAIDYLSADLSATNVMVKMDITSIQFPENSFDAIVCNHVLEHVPDDRKAMSELYRVLKPGGWAILQVPISLSSKSTYEDCSIRTSSGREQAFGQADHVRLYGGDYKDRLDQAGFNVSVFKWTTEPDRFGGPGNRFGLNEEEDVYVATKAKQ